MDNTSCPNTFLDIAIRVYVSHVKIYKTTIKRKLPLGSFFTSQKKINPGFRSTLCAKD